MPFDVAFAMVDGDWGMQAEALAMGVVFGQLEGGTFDWDRLEWKKRDG